MSNVINNPCAEIILGDMHAVHQVIMNGHVFSVPTRSWGHGWGGIYSHFTRATTKEAKLAVRVVGLLEKIGGVSSGVYSMFDANLTEHSERRLIKIAKLEAYKKALFEKSLKKALLKANGGKAPKNAFDTRSKYKAHENLKLYARKASKR